MAARGDASALVAEVAEGSKRLSELVAALKSYSFLDQGPVQNVDVAKGIDDTLLILKSKTQESRSPGSTSPTYQRSLRTAAGSTRCGPTSSTMRPTRYETEGSTTAESR